MEEKERYEVISPSLNGYAYIHDFKTDNVLNTYDSCDLLNQQSKRLKELEQENQQLKQQLAEKEKEIEYQESMKILAVKNQNQKSIEQLEKVKVLLQNAVNFEHPEYDLVGVYDAINDQIKQLKEMK